MNYLKSVNSQSWLTLGAVLLGTVFFVVPELSFAGGLGDVGNQVNSMMGDILTIITAVVTSGAVIALLFFCFQGLTGRKEWSELISAIAWCIGIGIAAPFVRWIIKTASSTSFG